MICQIQRLSFTSNAVQFDISGYDYVVAQFVNPSGTVGFSATNDNGYTQGTVEGNASTAVNFTTVQATKLSDGTAVTTAAAAGLYRFGVVGRFLKFSGASAAADSIIVYLCKID